MVDGTTGQYFGATSNGDCVTMGLACFFAMGGNYTIKANANFTTKNVTIVASTLFNNNMVYRR